MDLETDLGRFVILQISSQPRMMSLLVYFPSACCVWLDQERFCRSTLCSNTSSLISHVDDIELYILYFPPPSINTNTRQLGVTIDHKCYCPNNIRWKFWFNNIWYDRRSINQLNSFMRRKILFQSEPFKKPDAMCWFDRCFCKLFFIRIKKTPFVLNFFREYRK